MANPDELLINLVKNAQPKMLTGWNQKVHDRLFDETCEHRDPRSSGDRQGLPHFCNKGETR